MAVCLQRKIVGFLKPAENQTSKVSFLKNNDNEGQHNKTDWYVKHY